MSCNEAPPPKKSLVWVIREGYRWASFVWAQLGSVVSEGWCVAR